MRTSTMYARVNRVGNVETSYSHNFTNGLVTYSSKGGFEEWVRAAENASDTKINVVWADVQTEDLECCGNCRCCPLDGACDKRVYGV